MKKAIVLAVIIFCVPNLYAQTNPIDSLQQLLKTEEEHTSRAKLLSSLAYAYLYSKPDTALLLSQQGLSLSQKEGYTKGEAENLNMIGNVFVVTGNYPKALEAYLQCLKKSESIGDKERIIKTTGNIGAVYTDQGDYRKSLDYTLKNLALAKSAGIKRSVETAFLNLGNTYEKLDILDSAKYYTIHAYNLSVQLNDKSKIGLSLDGFKYSFQRRIFYRKRYVLCNAACTYV